VPRSAPGLIAVAVVETCLLAIYFVSGKTRINIEVPLSGVDWVVLAILLLALPAASVAGWLIARLVTDRSQVVVSALSVAVALACGIAVGGGNRSRSPSPRFCWCSI
jgi:Kef-type K+ transport system membrane component KefB